MADIRTNDAPAAALAASPPPALPAAAHAELAAAVPAPLAAQLVVLQAKLDAVQAEFVDVKSELAATKAQLSLHDKCLGGPPGLPPLAATPASTTRPPPSTTSDAAHAKRFRPDATNEWDRMPAEIQNMILAHAGDLTLWLNGRIDDLSNISFEQFKLILVEVFELDWQGDLTKLPFKELKYCRLDESFWRIRSRGMHTRVKLLGLDFLQDGLDQAAILNGWTDLLEFDNLCVMSINAARCGSVSMLQNLFDERKFVWLHYSHAEEAAKFGHLEMLKWLAGRMPVSDWTTWVMDEAAGSGNLDCVKFLHAYRTEGCTTEAMDRAAENGHLDVVKWLHDNRTEGCTRAAMHLAAANGHLEVIEFLHKHRREVKITAAAKAAAQHGRLAVIKHIYALAPNAITSAVVDSAASCDQIDLLDWIVDNTTARLTSAGITLAAKKCNLCVLLWLRRRLPEILKSHAIYRVDGQSADFVFGWLERDKRRPEFLEVLRYAIEEQQTLVLRWIHQHLADVRLHHQSLWKENPMLLSVVTGPSVQ
ncbi:hypothetical protein HK105_206366 [Polyrhizophydium stewartii]|uniref:Ankyrin repeat protein n=1 Tax=Polyrhizophydium stewartii TaxID=2732419 RepID=A0ABR4N3J0_9FUNG